MNSFQKWAIKELFAVNIHAQPLGNWITFKSEVTGPLTGGTIMSEQGVRDLVNKAVQHAQS